MVDLSPVSFLGNGGLASLPDPFAEQQAVQQAQQQKLVTQSLVDQRDAIAQQRQAAIAEQQRKVEQEQQYQTDVSEAIRNPTAANFGALIAKHPDQLQALKASWDAQDEPRKRANLAQLGNIYSYVSAGKRDLAIKAAQARVDADKAAGEDTTDDEQFLALLNSDDPDALNQAKGIAGLHLATALGPDKFADAVKQLGLNPDTDAEGKVVGKSIGHYEGDRFVVDYTAPDAPEYRSVAPGEKLLQVGGGSPSIGGGATRRMGWTPSTADGGDNPPEAVANKIKAVAQQAGIDPNTPLTREQVMSLPIHLMEGGRGSLADRNNNPGNIRNSDGSYRRFPTKEAGFAAQRALLGRFYDRGQRSITDIIAGRPVGGGQGGARVVAQGAAKPGYSILSATEKHGLGLPTNITFQRSPDGKVEAVSGQDTRTQQAQAVPAIAQKAILENHSTVREIDRAIKLLKGRPQSIGIGTGALGDWFTQRNDPAGTPVRAAIGKIGGKIIHDVSGAAVTMSEAPRFQPYVPTITDSPDTALKKLRQMRELATADQGDLVQAFGPENGYRGVKLPGQQTPVRVSSPTQAAKLPNGTLYVRPDGKVMRR